MGDAHSVFELALRRDVVRGRGPETIGAPAGKGHGRRYRLSVAIPYQGRVDRSQRVLGLELMDIAGSGRGRQPDLVLDAGDGDGVDAVVLERLARSQAHHDLGAADLELEASADVLGPADVVAPLGRDAEARGQHALRVGEDQRLGVAELLYGQQPGPRVVHAEQQAVGQHLLAGGGLAQRRLVADPRSTDGRGKGDGARHHGHGDAVARRRRMALPGRVEVCLDHPVETVARDRHRVAARVAQLVRAGRGTAGNRGDGERIGYPQGPGQMHGGARFVHGYGVETGLLKGGREVELGAVAAYRPVGGEEGQGVEPDLGRPLQVGPVNGERNRRARDGDGRRDTGGRHGHRSEKRRRVEIEDLVIEELRAVDNRGGRVEEGKLVGLAGLVQIADGGEDQLGADQARVAVQRSSRRLALHDQADHLEGIGVAAELQVDGKGVAGDDPGGNRGIGIGEGNQQAAVAAGAHPGELVAVQARVQEAAVASHPRYLGERQLAVGARGGVHVE